MIVRSRTPLRVSLFGGGTDYPAYFHRRPGAVLGMAINKYIYMTALRLEAFVDYRFRLSYSVVEHVDEIEDIAHPVARAVFQHYGWRTPIDISIQSDLPAAAGLGSSSAFTVGFLNLASHLRGQRMTKAELARMAIHVEQTLLRENVGVQDQLHAAHGGMNRFDLNGEDFRIRPLNITGAKMDVLTDSLALVYTGVKRRATDVVADQISNTAAKKVDGELDSLVALVDQAQVILESDRSGEQMALDIGALLHEGWRIKKSLAAGITNPVIDELYEVCLAAGGVGGKLCGAGAGGFLLMAVPADRRGAFEQTIGPRRCVRFAVDLEGASVAFQGDRA